MRTIIATAITLAFIVSAGAASAEYCFRCVKTDKYGNCLDQRLVRCAVERR
jgi:hypothetical protein